MKKLGQFLEVHILETLCMIYFKFAMWGTDGGGHLHSKNGDVSCKQHEVTYTQKSHYCFFCQHTHGCCVLASWAARHTTVCLD